MAAAPSERERRIIVITDGERATWAGGGKGGSTAACSRTAFDASA